jgi:carboxypeptidase Taq
MSPDDAYRELVALARETAVLASCSAILGWDEQTYMPKGASEHRGSQMALLAGIQHERATAPLISELLSVLEGSSITADAESVSAVNVRELRRSYDRRTKLPRTLVEELARATSLAQHEWVASRAANDFERFRPWLDKIFQLKRAESACLAVAAPGGDLSSAAGSSAGPRAAGRKSGHAEVYDPLLDEFEPGATTAELAGVFKSLKSELVPLIATLSERHARPAGDRTVMGTSAVGDGILTRQFPRERQRVFAEAAAGALGFDFNRGRLDVTAHPFCTGIGPGDCRITTRYDEHQFGDAFFGVLHEVGHGLYEQGLDPAHYGTPMGEAASLGVHESQSRLWENAVGRGRAFWSYWFPLAQSIFREALRDVSIDAFHRAVNRVEPSLIRVQADEATYNLHIIVRFELEQALLSGTLAAADVPAAWNEKYRETLGVTPRTDAEGCLQDIHWSAGLVGYFPTYTLGNIYAAQLFARARAELGDLDGAFARGDFRPLLEWLRAQVHVHGQRYRPAKLIERITGSNPDHRPLVESLRRKYAEVYGV